MGLNAVKILSLGLTASAVYSALCLSAAASTITPKFDGPEKVITSSTPTHAVFLKCKVSEALLYQSKGAVLAPPAHLAKAGKDVALVTGHGLIQGADCYVSDFLGNLKKVLSVSFADNYKSGTETDWAIISFEQIEGQHIQRYDIDHVPNDPAGLGNQIVTFAQARGLPENNQTCRLADSAAESLSENGTIIGHNCRAIGGQSGSPITQIIDGRHKLIGFHIGSGWTIKSPMTGKPGRLNFMRSLDEEMATEIKQALSEME
ncbi:MAG: hypothetical protein ABJN69_15420 [Hellea sp.]